jgi:hypothetical protein
MQGTGEMLDAACCACFDLHNHGSMATNILTNSMRSQHIPKGHAST